MKASAVVNISTFVLIAAVTCHALLSLTGSQQDELRKTERLLEAALTRHAELRADTLAYLRSEQGNQDALATEIQRLDELLNRLRSTAARDDARGPAIGVSAEAAADAVQEALDRANRIRSQAAVLKNATANLPRLLDDARIRLAVDDAARRPVEDIAESLSFLGGPEHDSASAAILAACSRLARVGLSADKSEEADLVRLAVAQAKTSVAYHSFLAQDVEDLLSDRVIRRIDSATEAVNRTLADERRADTRSLRVLTIASAALIAFVAAGMYRFKEQSDQLRGLNRELEERVQARTRELEEARRLADAQLLALDRVQGRVEFTTGGLIVDANDNFASIVGYKPEELIGVPHRTLVSPEIAGSAEYERFWKQLRLGEFQLGEYERVAKDGSKRWIRATYTPVVDDTGHIERIVKYVTDETKSKLSELKAQEATRKLANLARIIRDSPNELYIFDADTLRFVEVNQGAIDSIGYPREDLLRLTPCDIKPDYDEPAFRQAIAPLTNGDVGALRFQTIHRRNDGSDYPVQVSLHMSEYAGASVYVAFVTDLSEAKRLEQQLAQAQKLESIGQLAAGVAHEINTPMQYVNSNIEFLIECSKTILKVTDAYAELLESDAPLEWSDRVEMIRRLLEESRFNLIRAEMPTAIEESREGVRRTVSIIRAMKDFSHPGATEMSDACLNDLVDSAVAITRNRWKYTAEVTLELDPGLPTAPMLVSEINQVLLNLIVNASDAITEANAGEESDSPQGRITVRTRADDDHVFLEVADNGCGMSDEVRRKVFDPFFTTKDVGKGTGQGLSIVHKVIVSQHGGDVSLATKLGEGSTFTIALPRAGAALADESVDLEVEAVR